MRTKVYIKNTSIGLLLLVLLAGCTTNWRENFRAREKGPFGTYIIYNELEDLFDRNDVHMLKENIYDHLYYGFSYNPDYGNYICIKSHAYNLKEEGVAELLVFVYHGNKAFLSLNEFSAQVQEELGIATTNLDSELYQTADLKALNGTLTLENEKFEQREFTYDRNLRRHYFSDYNTENTVVLGTVEIDGESHPNFIKIYHGEGAIYLHAQPIAFSNYYMLNGNEAYAANVLSYLPSVETYWDPQTKSSTIRMDDEEEQESIFKFFYKHQTLKWFLLTALIGLLTFMIFNARRKQRAIPIINPPKNSTVEFTQTIASLYLKEKDHKNLVDSKIVYFLEKIRTKYQIDTNNLNEEFIKNLALKSGSELSNTKYLINTIIAMKKETECTEQQLITFNRMIEYFLQNK